MFQFLTWLDSIIFRLFLGDSNWEQQDQKSLFFFQTAQPPFLSILAQIKTQTVLFGKPYAGFEPRLPYFNLSRLRRS